MEIILKTGSQGFRKIFTNQENTIRQERAFPGYYVLIFLLIPGLLIVAPLFMYHHVFIFVVALIIFPGWVFHLFTASKTIYQHYRRKKILNQYCRYLDNIQSAKIYYDDTHLELTIDGKTDVFRWIAFEELTLTEDFMELKTDRSTYLFPKGNMAAQEFEDLSDFVKTKVKSA